MGLLTKVVVMCTGLNVSVSYRVVLWTETVVSSAVDLGKSDSISRLGVGLGSSRA